LHRFHCRHRCKLAPGRMMHNFESDMPEMVKFTAHSPLQTEDAQE
jgi:hypothetical protein